MSTMLKYLNSFLAGLFAGFISMWISGLMGADEWTRGYVCGATLFITYYTVKDIITTTKTA